VYKLPRGTRDFLPEEMEKRRNIEKSMKNSFEKFGYAEVKTPVFENLELFTAKSGDVIINELYNFKDKKNRELSLRPEMTAPVIRLYVDKLQMNPKPLKLFYFGNCYRYDRPQKGRYREFKQAGCEIIGTDNPESLAELIFLAYKILIDVGLKNIILNIGNLKILSYIFDEFKLTEEQRKYIVPLIDKSQFEDLLNVLIDFNIDRKQANMFIKLLNSNNLNDILISIENNKIKNELDELNEILNLLKISFKIPYRFKLGIVRGLDYYNGTVFEIEAPLLGAEKQICGGGSYNLIKIFGGKETPTSGFALGFDRTIIALEAEKYKFPKKQLDVYIIPVNYGMLEKSIEILNLIRDNNINSDIDLLRRGVSKSLKYASSINVKNSVIIGPKEIDINSVTIRDMKTGTQKSTKIENLITYLKNTL
jgi:histidyl-tRNA synthetase